MEATLQAFIKALNNFLKHTEYKQFKISNKQIVYLLENKSVISVLIKKDLNKKPYHCRRSIRYRCRKIRVRIFL